MSLTRNVDSDLARRALIGALLFYTRETSAHIIAEGIETEAQLDAVTEALHAIDTSVEDATQRKLRAQTATARTLTRRAARSLPTAASAVRISSS